GDAVHGAGRARVRVLPDAKAGDADSDTADDAQRRELRRVAVAARAVAGGGGRERRRDAPPRDGGDEAAGGRRSRARDPYGREGPGAKRRGASELRARLGRRR